MTTENLTTLEIHKLKKGQYEKLEALGKLVQNALYLTPEEPIDLDPYLTEEEAAAIYATQKDLTDMSHIYANGTLVNLNGTSYSKKTASFFAPVDNGDKGNFLQSNGENEAPSWIDAQTARGNLGFSGAVTSIISEDLKQDRVLVSSDSGKVIVSDMPVETLMGLESKITGAVGTLEASIAGIKSGIEADISTKISALDDKKEDKINILPITKGGTGASSASEALTQLGAIAITQVGSKGGVAPLNASGKISDTYLPSYVPLESNGLISSNYLPSYVDDVLEFANKTNFPATGEPGKIYVDTTNKLTYRWSGSEYVEISKSLALGESSTTAYRGDLGKIAYNHSQSVHTIPMGGTGAITAEAARANLGAAAASHTHSYAGSSTVGGAANSSNKLELFDTRKINEKPSEVIEKTNTKGIRFDFKENSVIGISDEGTYSTIQNIRQWTDKSGGKSTQIAYSDSGAIRMRKGDMVTDTWESWKTVAYTDSDVTGAVNRTYLSDSIYNPTKGVLIDFNINEKSGNMIILKLSGNSYSSGKEPIEAIYQFYDNASGGLNSWYAGTTLSGPAIDLKIFRVNKKLKAWFQHPATSCTFKVEVTYGQASKVIPKITLSDDVEPTVTVSVNTTVTIVPKKVFSSDSTLTQNRLLTRSGDYIVATNNYVADRKLAIGSSSAPNENLYVNGTSKFNGAVTMNSTATIAGVTKITNDTNSSSYLNGALIVSGGIGVTKDIRVGGIVYVGASSTTATTNKLTINGQSQFNGNAAITGTLNVTGATTLSNNLTVNGNTTLGNANTDTTTVQGSFIQKNGHIYLDGASTASSTTNTTQIIFRQGTVEHIALSSNGDCFIINPSSSTTANQIALYLGEKSTTNTSVLPSALSAAGFTTTGAISGGSLDISGAATVKTLTISDNAGSSHIKFSRNNGINYLHVPTGGSLGVCIGDLSTDNCPFVVKSDMIYPYKTNTIGLGSSSYKWKHLYVGTGGLFSAGTIYPSTANSCNIGTASYIWKYMYGERYYTYDATNKYQGGSFYTANSAATSEQTTYLMLGNNTANGTAGNRTGRMRLYGKSSGYGEIVGPNTTSNYSIYLPTSPQSGTNYMAIGDESGDAFKATLLKPTEANTTGVKGTWVGGIPSTGKVIWREAFTHSDLNSDSGDIVFWLQNQGTSATLNVLIDGCFYQRGQNGFYKVLDEKMIITNYGTGNPPTSAEVGQVYFKII